MKVFALKSTHSKSFFIALLLTFMTTGSCLFAMEEKQTYWLVRLLGGTFIAPIPAPKTIPQPSSQDNTGILDLIPEVKEWYNQNTQTTPPILPSKAELIAEFEQLKAKNPTGFTRLIKTLKTIHMPSHQSLYRTSVIITIILSACCGSPEAATMIPHILRYVLIEGYRAVAPFFGAIEVTEQSAPQLYSILQSASIKTGIPRPPLVHIYTGTGLSHVLSNIHARLDYYSSIFNIALGPDCAALVVGEDLIVENQRITPEDLESLFAYHLFSIQQRNELITFVTPWITAYLIDTGIGQQLPTLAIPQWMPLLILFVVPLPINPRVFIANVLKTAAQLRTNAALGNNLIGNAEWNVYMFNTIKKRYFADLFVQWKLLKTIDKTLTKERLAETTTSGSQQSNDPQDPLTSSNSTPPNENNEEIALSPNSEQP